MADPSDPLAKLRSYQAPTGPAGSIYDQPVPYPRGPSILGLDPQRAGPLGGVAQMVIPMVSEMFRDQLGGFGFMFNSDMNITQSKYAREFLQQLNAARRQGAEADKDEVEAIFRGLGSMLGHRTKQDEKTGRRRFENDDVEKAVQRLAADGSSMLPILAAIFPDTVDRILPKGSMAVANASFTSAGRFMVDPATGRSMAEDPTFGARVLKPLLDGDVRDRSGLGAGRLGQTYEALAARGLVGGEGAELREQVRVREEARRPYEAALGAVAGRAAGDAALDQAGVGVSGEKAKEIQADRAREKIANYAKAVSAINDIFAENGRPDAPMSELIKSLDVLTQGGIGKFDPLKLAQMTREFQAASQLTGLSKDALAEVSAGTGMMLERFGARREFAGSITTRTVGAGGKAYKALGFAEDSLEGMTVDEANAERARRASAGAGSEMMNLVGAVQYLSRAASADSDLGRLGKALGEGQTKVKLGDGTEFDLLNATPSDIAELTRKSGIDPQRFLAQLANRNQNQAALLNDPKAAQRLAEAGQRKETEDLLTRGALGDVTGLGDPKKLVEALRKASNDPTVKNAKGQVSDDAVADAVARQLGFTKVDDKGQVTVDADRKAQIMNLLGQLGMRLDPTGRTGGYNQFRLTSPELQKETDRGDAEIAARAEENARNAAFARGGTIRTVMTEIANQGNQGPGEGLGVWRGLVLKGLAGMVEKEEVEKAKEGPNPLTTPYKNPPKPGDTTPPGPPPAPPEVPKPEAPKPDGVPPLPTVPKPDEVPPPKEKPDGKTPGAPKPPGPPEAPPPVEPPPGPQAKKPGEEADVGKKPDDPTAKKGGTMRVEIAFARLEISKDGKATLAAEGSANVWGDERVG